MPSQVISKDDFESTLRSRYDELRAHAMSGAGAAPEPEVSLRGCFRSAADLARAGEPKQVTGRAQFDLWWMNCPSEGLPVLLWDRWECHDLSRTEYERMLEAADGAGLPMPRVIDDKEWLGERPALRPLPTWKYHPERFKGVMPFATRVAQIGRECKGNPDTHTLNALIGAWQDADTHGFAAKPLRERVASASRNSRAMFRLTDMLMFHAVFAANGRQIFDIPSQLGEMFRRTDIDDITAESIKVPYPGIYLHFGPQQDLAFDPDWIPEGAYVYELRDDGDGDRVLQFCIVFAPTDLERYRDFDVHIEPVYTQALAQAHMKMPLGEAVDLVLSDKLAQLRKEAGSKTMPGLEEAGEANRLAQERGVTLVSTQAERASAELEGVGPQHRCYLEMLKLIVNSLAYLTAYPKDVETQWPAKTSASLLKQLAKTDNRNEQRRIQSKLAALGFTPVHLCGRRLAQEIERAAASQGQGSRTAHWRRGHWRRQPHGPQNSLRKLVWLMPTLVNPAGSTEEPLGHLYLVT